MRINCNELLQVYTIGSLNWHNLSTRKVVVLIMVFEPA